MRIWNVNTLVRDEERRDVADTLAEIANSGADAIIVQDMTVVRLAKSICPELALHASTQMAVHNAAGVLTLEDLGFSRVVLARELTIEEIRRIRERTNIELECFVHGALCMSASGMCYLSAMLGERSGNRGLCAQPCRLPFVCNGANYALSLKDMSHIAHYHAFKEIGVSLTQSLLMTPSKSVTALIGVSKEPGECRRKGCEQCEAADNCAYRA